MSAVTIPPALKALRRSAWRPVTKQEDGPPAASKLGGTPYLAPQEAWPTCSNCGKPMTLFLQLDLSTVPTAIRGDVGEGLVQFFYCTSADPLCEADCESYFPFTEAKLVRLIALSDEEPVAAAVPEGTEVFPPHHIVGWEEVTDYPEPWMEDDLDIPITDAEEEALVDQLDAAATRLSVAGDKLWGWPAWIQGPEYPDCPTCGRAMHALFQIDSDDHLPYYFGDVGTGHVTQCPEHPDVLAFGWACT